MITQGISAFAGKSVLLLQGPVGPFFRLLAADLRRVGATVHKVNFNGGDLLFYPRGGLSYRGDLAQWPAWLESLVAEQGIDVIMLFGDCRPIHQAARALAERLGLELGVFEEGYVRPDFITLERHGVNGHSRMPRTPGRYRAVERAEPTKVQAVGGSYWHAVLWAVLYYLAAVALRPVYARYVHHRRLSLLEALPWIRSALRKWLYRWREAGIEARLAGEASRRFFLVPLQVHNDAQVHVHSDFDSVPQFIRAVMKSFSRSAPADTLLVFKHHPMDRGYHDYGARIAELSRRYGVAGRVLYIHDQHLPTLLDHARGVVVVNSTVGLQALHHLRPLKVCGTAIYDMPGLTYQGRLSQFWCDEQWPGPDPDLLQRYHHFLVATTQLNGSFYRRLRGAPLATGVRWAPGDPTASTPAAADTRPAVMPPDAVSGIRTPETPEDRRLAPGW